MLCYIRVLYYIILLNINHIIDVHLGEVLFCLQPLSICQSSYLSPFRCVGTRKCTNPG